MSKRAARTTKRERRERRAVERSELTITRDCLGRRILCIVDEATAFERLVPVDAHPELAALVDAHEAEERAP
jgi:hypothetical protein